MRVSASFCFWVLSTLTVLFASASQSENDLESQYNQGATRNIHGMNYTQVPTTVDPMDTDELEPCGITTNTQSVDSDSETSTEFDSIDIPILGRLSALEKFKRRFMHGLQKFRLSQYVPLVIFVQLINVAAEIVILTIIYGLKYQEGESLSVEEMMEYFILSVIVAFAFASYLYAWHCFSFSTY